MSRLTKSEKAQYAERGLKYCHGCDHARDVDEFSVDRSKADGRAYRCRECISRRLTSQKQTCIDCNGPMSMASANRCIACHKARAQERQNFQFFSLPFYYNDEALKLLGSWHVRWPDAKERLFALTERAVNKATENAEHDGLNPHSYLWRNPWGARSTSDPYYRSIPDSDLTLGDTLT